MPNASAADYVEKPPAAESLYILPTSSVTFNVAMDNIPSIAWRREA